MKKLYSLVAIAMISFTANAQVASDNFTYTGALNANGWTTHSGTGGQIVSDGSKATIIAGNSEDINLAFPSFAMATGLVNKVTYTATVNVLNDATLAQLATGDYNLMLGKTSGAGVTLFYARLYVKGTVTGYSLGILNNSGGSVTPSYGTEIPYGTPANITVVYVVDKSVSPLAQYATLQIDSQAQLSNNTGTGTAATDVASLCIRQSTGTGNVTFDNITVTTSAPLAVKELIGNNTRFVKNTQVNQDINFGTKADVKIFSMNGQLVKSASVSENKSLDVAELAPGMYIVTGTVDGVPVSQKIMKK